MSDIFISYAHEDREAAARLAHALEDLHWTVFWDRVIPAGKTWREVIGTALTDAKCVIVLWSGASIASHWVIEEAELGLKRRILLPIFVEPVEPPLGFRSVQAADLSGWDGTLTAREYQDVARDVRAIAGAPTGTTAGDNAAGATLADGTSTTGVSPERDRKRSIVSAWVGIGAVIAVAVIGVAVLVHYRTGPGKTDEPPSTIAAPPSSGPAPDSKTSVVAPARDWALRVHFINVGQAASTLLEFPSAVFLVDAGTDGDESKTHLLDYLRDFFQSRPELKRRLDALVLTHPHVDHVNAALDILRNHPVGLLIDNGDDGTGSGGTHLRAARAYASSRKIRQLQLKAVDTVQGHVLEMPGDGTIRLVGGSRDCANKNNDSLVVEAVILNSSLLLPADADLDDSKCEGLIPYLMSHARLQHDDVLQVPHHGSTSGMSVEFLKRVSPVVAVISAGRVDIAPKTAFDAFNYGHPRANTVDELARIVSGNRDTRRVFAMGASKQPTLMELSRAVYCTCWDGDIVISLDGTGRPPKVERPGSRP